MNSVFEKSKELMRLWGAFRGSRVLFTANNYRVFDVMTKPSSVVSVSKKLKTNTRATNILLDALTGLKLLKKTNNYYVNTRISSLFLVQGNRYYQGDMLRHADNMWKKWSFLDEVIKTGRPYRIPNSHNAFILGMHNLASLKAKDIVMEIRLKGVRTALDLGGGPGTYAIEMAKKGIAVTLFDRPDTIKIARKIVKNSGAKNIRFIEGDFICDDIGKGYDLIFASQILHSNSEKENLRLIKKCRRALNPEGRIVIQEFFITKDLTQPLSGSLFSVNMLVGTEAGRCYSQDEMKGWFKKAGMKTTRKKIMGEAVLIEAVKT